MKAEQKKPTSLDAHAHFNPHRSTAELKGTGAVLAGTLSLDEAEKVIDRKEANIIWGVGCHPRKLEALRKFESVRFRDLAQKTGLISEVGLDKGARTPLELQIKVFQLVLATIAEMPRIVSVHSYQATELVIEELSRIRVTTPILHWWTGTVKETIQAVELGCYFSIHSAVARHSKFRLQVPIERVLVESDHGWNDPPGAIPYRIRWVEYLAAQQYGLEVDEFRSIVWKNFSRIVDETKIRTLLPPKFNTRISNKR